MDKGSDRARTRFRRGIRGLWDRLTGQAAKLRDQNERETVQATERDARERQTLIERQLDERRRLQREIDHTRRRHTRDMTLLHSAQRSHVSRQVYTEKPDRPTIGRTIKRRLQP